MPNNTLYYDEREMNLAGHHVKSSVITRLDKGYISVFDITQEDLNRHGKEYLGIAESKDIPVFLTARAKKRLLIFNKKLC